MAGCRMGRWLPIWRARSASCKVDGRRFRVALLPTEIPASREPGRRLNPQLRRIPAEMRADLTSAEIAISGSYFDDVLRDPRRYGIENTTDKVRRPGAVRRRRDAVCTERIVAHSYGVCSDGWRAWCKWGVSRPELLRSFLEARSNRTWWRQRSENEQFLSAWRRQHS